MENDPQTQDCPRDGGRTLLVWKTAFLQALDFTSFHPVRRAIGEAVFQAAATSSNQRDRLGVSYYENAIVRASVKFTDELVCVFDLELKINPWDFDDDPTTPGGAVAATGRRLLNAVSKVRIVSTWAFAVTSFEGRDYRLDRPERAFLIRNVSTEARRFVNSRARPIVFRFANGSAHPGMGRERRAAASYALSTGDRVVGRYPISLAVIGLAAARLVRRLRELVTEKAQRRGASVGYAGNGVADGWKLAYM